MKPEKIFDGNLIIAIIIRSTDWKDGLNFVSSETDYQQVGMWGYNKGMKLAPHIHLDSPRQVMFTQEVVFVKDGRLRADLYTKNKKFLKSVELITGDAMILLNGGHGYEVMENNTKVLEIKNGPYTGPDKDRERI